MFFPLYFVKAIEILVSGNADPVCGKIIQFAVGLGMEAVQPSMMNLLQGDCLQNGTGVTKLLLSNINWSNLNLAGSINATNIPPNLETLDLHNNLISGSIPCLNGFELPKTVDLSQNKISGTLPVNCYYGPYHINFANNNISGTIPEFGSNMLYTIDLGNNQLSGTIPTYFTSASFPLMSNVAFLDLHGNSLSGSIPTPLVTQLKTIDFSDNQLSGGVPTFPNSRLVDVNLSKNKLTGTISAPLPVALQTLELQDNLLYGPIALPTSVVVLNLGTSTSKLQNNFDGSIVLNAPTKLNLFGNSISDILIYNSSNLVQCDLSSNPLLGNNNINALGVCIREGLFNISETRPIVFKASTTIAKSNFETLFVSQNNSMTLNLFHATPINPEFSITAAVVEAFKLFVYFVFLVVVIKLTPFKREFKRKIANMRKSEEPSEKSFLGH